MKAEYGTSNRATTALTPTARAVWRGAAALLAALCVGGAWAASAPAWPLNDTGIDWWTDGTQNNLAAPPDGYPGQDASQGRDASQDNDADGHAGFSYTKLDANGQALAASATAWSCVRDNVTGLIWEVKPDDGGLRDPGWSYSWYNPDATSNGGSPGYRNQGSCGGNIDCDTLGYTQAVNRVGLCGATDWRLPNRQELLSIVDRSHAPAIDTSYFPDVVGGFWSFSPSASNPDYAWGVDVANSSGYWSDKDFACYVRLVRGGQALPFEKTNQIIIFGAAPTVIVGGTGTLTATGGASGNPVTFSSQTIGICTTSGTNGSTVTGESVGTCTIAADQDGNDQYNPAPQATQSFAVNGGSDTDINIAYNPSGAGFPSPLESDPGWGGGSYPWEILDGKTYHTDTWAHGLAFTGGILGYGGPCGWRQATVDFGAMKTFDKMRVYHHGDTHIPNTYRVEYWDGTIWHTIDATSSLREDLRVPPSGVEAWGAVPTEHLFSPVTGSKARFALNNCDIEHGWIYEFEVFAATGRASQAITFGPAPSVIVGGTGAVTATGGASGNPVTFTSQTPAVCTHGGTNGSTITGETAGTCTIAANQAGNADYNAAPQVTQNIVVSQAVETNIEGTLIDAGRYSTCVIGSDGALVCWGDGNSIGNTIAPAGAFRQVSSGWWSGHICAVNRDGVISCWGNNNDGQASPPTGVFSQVSAGGDHTCAVTIGKTIACWGKNSDGQATPPTGTFSQVTAGLNHTCALRTDGGLTCWGRGDGGLLAAPAGTFSQVNAAERHTCALRTDDTLACWGDETNAPQGTFKQVSAGTDVNCAVRADGSLACWGPNAFELPSPPVGTFRQVGLGRYHGCAVRTDGTLACWGSERDQRSLPPAGTFLQISTGNYHSCGVHKDQTLSCWGGSANDDGQATPPAGAFGQVSTGSHHTCAVRLDGNLACWGSNENGQALPPTGQFREVAAGAIHSCGIRMDGTIACWGSNQYGQTDAPAGVFSKVIAGYYHNCAVRSDGSLACWGQDGLGESGPPAGTFTQVDASGWSTCALRTDGNPVCWDLSGSVAAPPGPFSAVTAGLSQYCAVRTNRTIACWGDNWVGEGNPPSGTFSQVSAGDFFTCGIRDDGYLVCWGYNGPAPRLALAPSCCLAKGYPQVAYDLRFQASGGRPPYQYAISAGSLPPGLTLGSDGVLTGTPTTIGTYGFSVRATDALAYPLVGEVGYTLGIGIDDQIITFGPAPTIVVGGTGTVTATGGASGNPVTFTSQTATVCTTSGTNGSTISGWAFGTCTIAANQAGNADYNAAEQVTQSFSIGDASQSTCQTSAMVITGTSFAAGMHMRASGVSITTQGAVELLTGADVTFRAPGHRFGPGFRIATGARFQSRVEAVNCAALSGGSATTGVVPATLPAPEQAVSSAAPLLIAPDALPAWQQDLLTAQGVDLAAIDHALSDAQDQWLLFETVQDLAPGDHNGTSDIYRLDLGTATLRLISRTAQGAAGNGASRYPAADALGDWVVFQSEADDLVADDANGVTDLFLHEVHLGATRRITATTDQPAAHPVLDPTGQDLLYDQAGTDGRRQILAGRLWVPTPGEALSLEQDSRGRLLDNHHPALSADGRYVAYLEATAEGEAARCQVHFYDRDSGRYQYQICPAELAAAGEEARPSFSADATQVEWFLPGAAASVTVANPLSTVSRGVLR